MRRREFIQLCTVGGASLAWACDDPGQTALGLPEPEVGEGYLVFDGGQSFRIEPDLHQVVVLGEPERIIGGLGIEHGNLNRPSAVAVGPEGLLYIVERGNSRISVFDAQGALQRVIGEGELFTPRDLAFFEDRLYVADTLNNRVAVFDLQGRLLSAIGDIELPRAVVFDGSGTLHVLDAGSGRVRTFAPSGEEGPSYGEEATWFRPSTLALDAEGARYVGDVSSAAVYRFEADGALSEVMELRWPNGRRGAPVHLGLQHDGGLRVAMIQAFG